MKYILIIGAKSDIAKELARIYAANGFCLYLAARKSDELISFKEEIGNSSVDIQLLELDVTCFDLHQEFYKILDPKPAGVIFVAGILFSQVEYDNNWDKIIKTINTNYVGALSILNIIAADFEKRKDGFIIGIGSVAGDRGRRSNIYMVARRRHLLHI
jgi:short-chain dehydrogenase/reductase SDR